MLNLGQLCTAVGQRLGIDTTAGTRDGNAVRAFATLRHDQLYRSFLWKDSLIEFVLPINPATPYVPTANYLPAKGHIILPPIFQHVLGARFDDRSLNIQRPQIYYRANMGYFLNLQPVCEYYLLSSCVWEFDTVQSLGVTIQQNADLNVNITEDVLAADEITVNRIVSATTQNGTAVGSSDRIDTLIKPATQGQVSLGYQNGTQLGVNLVAGGAQYINNVYPVNGLVPGQAYQITWGANETSFVYSGGTINNPGAGQTTQFTYPVYAVGNKFIGLSGNPVTASVQQILPVYIPIITLQAGDLSAPKSQRIQLVGTPSVPFATNNNLHILGKRTTPPFSADSDVVGVNGLDGILFALLYYDMAQRDERGGTPDVSMALNEAVGPRFLTDGKPGGFLGKLVEEETVQEATNTRIVPEEGFGGSRYFDEPWGSKGSPYNY